MLSKDDGKKQSRSTSQELSSAVIVVVRETKRSPEQA